MALSGIGQGPTSGLVFACLLVTLFRSCLSGTGTFLSGVFTFRFQDAGTHAPDPKSAGGDARSKKERKMSRRMEALGGILGRGVVMCEIGPLTLSHMAFNKDLDHLVRGARGEVC